MKSLNVIVKESNEIEQMLLESDGELTEAIQEALTVNEFNLADKIDSYSFIMERFEALEKHYKERAEFFNKISKQCAAVQDRLENNIKYAMQTLNKDVLIGQDIKYTLKPTAGSLIIEDEDMVPVEFKSEKMVTDIDKKKLKDALTKAPIPGARIEPGYSLKKSANTPDKKLKKVASNE